MGSIGDRIRKRREEIGITQDDLALKVGYSGRSSVNKIEMGLQDIPRKKVEAFAAALNTTVDYLMGGTDPLQEKVNRVEYHADMIAHLLGYDLVGDPAEGYVAIRHAGSEIPIEMRKWELYEHGLITYADFLLSDIIAKEK